MKRNIKNLLMFLILVMTILTGCIGPTGTINEDVKLPEWGNLFCGQKPEQTNAIYETGTDFEKVEYYCSAPTIRGYYPEGCDFYYSRSREIAGLGFSSKIHLCDGNEDNLANCGVVANTEVTTERFITHAKQGQKIVIQKEIFETGGYVIRINAQPYGLWNQELGHLLVTQSCDVKSLGAGYTQLTEDVNAANFEQGTILRVGQIVNYVVGSRSISSPTNVINHNGKLIYITQPEHYYEVKRGQDGKLYADTRKSIFDSSIVCVPSNPYCADDASKILDDPSGKGCGALSGNIEGYVQTSSSELCKFSCINNELVNTQDCKNIPTSCPPEKPLWDSIKAECVGVGILSICGDGVCSGTEDASNCPTDCATACEPIWSLDLPSGKKFTILPNISAKCVSWFAPFIWITTIMGALITFFFSFNFADRINKKTKKTNVFISLILAAGVGFLIYLYWWVFIIIIILLAIIRMILR